MKNLLFGLIAFVFFGAIQSNAQTINELDTDKDFIAYLESNDVFVNNAKNDRKLADKIFSDSNLTEQELPEFYLAFNTNEKNYTYFIDKQNSILKSLAVKYKFDSYSNLIEILNTEINEVYSKALAGGGNCKRRYVNALTINAAAATAGHYACVGLDLTTGPGGLLCHGAVVLGHMAANDNAYLDYQDCLKG